MSQWSLAVFGLSLSLGLSCALDAPSEPAAPDVASKRKEAPRSLAPGEQETVPSTGIPDPLSGLNDRELCSGTPAQLLLKYELGTLQKNQCRDVCCPLDSAHWCCEFDFPFSDTPPCDAWAVMRNEIFARYGYPFTEQRWRDEFETESWYVRREDFDTSWLSPIAARNITTLKAYEINGTQCTR